jgi:hypothetical protein
VLDGESDPGRACIETQALGSEGRGGDLHFLAIPRCHANSTGDERQIDHSLPVEAHRSVDLGSFLRQSGHGKSHRECHEGSEPCDLHVAFH